MAVFPAPPTFNVLQIPTAIDYTSKDFVGFRTSMLNYAKQVMPDWDTTSEGDFGVMLVELFAYMGDILSYYGDRISQEAYLPTATQRLSLLNIAQLLAYIPNNGTPASGTVTLQTANPGVAVSVPAGTQIATGFNGSLDQPIIYETQSSATVAANGGTQTVTVIQGETQTLVPIGTSNGTSGQTYMLPDLNVIDGTVQVYVETTTGYQPWQSITYLVNAGPSDEVYETRTDANGNTIVYFGDNVNGMVPAIGLPIAATYRIGVGSAGNQPAGMVGMFVDAIDGVSVPFLADGITYNSSAMTGGSDPETNDQIRANAPLGFQTQQRAVSPADFNALAINVPGVILANAVANHSTSINLYILGPGAQAPSTQLQASVSTYFTGKILAGVTLNVLSPSLIKVDVGTSGNKVTLAVKNNYSNAVVTQNVTAAITSLLTPPSVGFGQLLNVSDIYNAIMSVAGVAYTIVPVFTRQDVTQTGTTSIQFRPSEVPVPGNIYINSSGGF